jgi:MSHA biogenesis protein MshJ
MSESPLIQKYQKSRDWFDAKPSRERLLLGLSLMALIFVIWNFLIQFPHDKHAAELKAQQAQLMTDKKTTQDQLTSLVTAFSNDPAKLKQNEIDQLTSVLKDIEVKLLEVSQGLIAADNLPQVLESVFHQTEGLTLISIKTLASTEMLIAQTVSMAEVQPTSTSAAGLAPTDLAPKATTNPNQVKGTGVFKHGVVLHLRGDYFRLHALLKSLESLSWKFYWESLDYQVKEYPHAEIELRVFTLSSEEGLLGV